MVRCVRIEFAEALTRAHPGIPGAGTPPAPRHESGTNEATSHPMRHATTRAPTYAPGGHRHPRKHSWECPGHQSPPTRLIHTGGLCRFASMPRLTLQTQAILATLLSDAARPHYGLEMAQAAGLASGTIYPILARLERAGWVLSTLEDIDPKAAGRRARRYYTLTAEGEQIARVEIADTLSDLRAASSQPTRAKRRIKPLPPLPGALTT